MKYLLLTLTLLTACATVPCKPAHELMKDRGLVLECYTVFEDGNFVDKCLIFKNSETKVHTVFKPHCGL